MGERCAFLIYLSCIPVSFLGIVAGIVVWAFSNENPEMLLAGQILVTVCTIIATWLTIIVLVYRYMFLHMYDED